MSSDALVANLQRRVAALEALVGGLGGSEALQPNYLTITPAGLVGANFSGVINAQGLVLPAGVSNTATPANRVVWERTSNGAIVASMTTWEGPGGSGTESVTSIISGGTSTAAGGGADNLAETALYAVPNAASSLGWLVLVADGTATGSVIEGWLQSAAGTINPIIARGDGYSDFVWADPAGPMRLKNGSASLSLSAGWASYSVTFPVAFAAGPVTAVWVVQPSTGATITSTESTGASTSGFTLDINSTIAQSAAVWYIAVGT